MCQWPRLRRRRRRRRKQRHAAALAALTSYPVHNRKSDGDAISPPRAGDVTEETRLTLLCPDDQYVRACDNTLSECHCTRSDRDLSNFCDRDCSASVNVEIGTSPETVRPTTNNVTECNHFFSRNQFTVV